MNNLSLRNPLILSVFAHIGLFMLLWLALPAHPPAATHNSRIEFQIEPKTLPPSASNTPAPPQIAAASRRPGRQIDSRPQSVDKIPTTPPVLPPGSKTAHPSSDEKPRGGPVDLTLHALPKDSGSSGTLIVPSAGSGGTGNGKAPESGAGDPILGKLRQKPQDPYPLQSLGAEGFLYEGKMFSAHILPDGKVSFHDKTITDFAGTSGSFDITDMIMRAKKQDPYRYEKQKFLEATVEQRAKLARQERLRQLARSVALLPSRAALIWGDENRSTAEKRKALFFLWRETYEVESDAIEAARQARVAIEKFIREQLPRGSQDAYTESELGRMHGPAGETFQPY